MATFAARGQGMNLVIDGNFIAKKIKILKNFEKLNVFLENPILYT